MLPATSRKCAPQAMDKVSIKFSNPPNDSAFCTIADIEAQLENRQYFAPDLIHIVIHRDKFLTETPRQSVTEVFLQTLCLNFEVLTLLKIYNLSV